MDSQFETRLERHGARLRAALGRLYDTDLWPRLLSLLRARHTERPSALLALDTERAANPAWFITPAMVGYKTYAEQFGGTVAGVTARVDYLEKLGVRYLHLLSLLKARPGDSDGGFAVSDYLAVEPRLGTPADLEALTARLRAAGISLSVDFALNHTADDHAWALAAQAGDPHYRAFYHVVSPEQARDLETHLPQVFPVTAPGNFTAVPAMGGHVWTSFYPFQWDLNWANPEVFLAMADTLLRMANQGFEAFRLDSIAYIWKDYGTDCRNRPKAHEVVRALRAVIDIAAPGVLLLGEAVVPTRFVSAYFGETDQPECHLVYNNSLMVAGWLALAEGKAEAVTKVIADLGAVPAAANWLSYARCHDDIGWSALSDDLSGDTARLAAASAALEGGNGWAHGEAFQTADTAILHGTNGTLASLCGLESDTEQAFARIHLLQALMLASGGLATLYMGDETGLANDGGYRSDREKAHDGRWLHRPAMDWRGVDSPAARRITAGFESLRAACIASGHAGPPVTFATGHDAVLGILCGRSRVYLNFSGHPAHAHGRDLPPYGVLWQSQST